MISILYLCDDRREFIELRGKLHCEQVRIFGLGDFRRNLNDMTISNSVCILRISYPNENDRGYRYHKIYLSPSLSEDLLPSALLYTNTEDLIRRRIIINNYIMSIKSISSLYKIDYNIFKFILELTKYELKTNGSINIISNKPSMTLKEIFINE